ncbi:MAG TPA: asparaginase [Bacteroidales bacterium]|nr:MAG: L-asparaginase [Bacteroidetes bacterium ADurb.Bin139]HOG25880.1 asparaginase [Bacteroidales bacterium]HOR12168.1 asparaginase [Bacteroidales bacterium]HOZ19946.1 asparaginase [Bacteroidales bacterium]HPK39864.1 asparaginase [Bacteroidales bacterium]
MSLKKYLLLATLCLWVLPALYGSQKPRITIIATGGTIAGTASSATGTSYDPAQLTVDALMAQAPGIPDRATITGLQLCNIASQHMTTQIWIRLAFVIDSLFRSGLCDGVVITHGTDTMEETAFFLELVLGHGNPVVLTGAMRPANGLGADGPANLFNAVCLAADPAARDRGVMAVLNDYIYAAAEFTKVHTVNPDAFESPDCGPLGVIRGGNSHFFRAPAGHLPSQLTCTAGELQELAAKLRDKVFPKVEIILSYAGATAEPLDALLKSGVDGIVIAGVGHGNYSREIEAGIQRCLEQGVVIVRATRVLAGGVTFDTERPFNGQIVSGMLNPQKARILLMLALTRFNTTEQLQEIFRHF